MRSVNTCFGVLAVLSCLVMSSVSGDMFYTDTKICSSHKSSFCLSLDKTGLGLILNKKNNLKFDIEPLDSSSNLIYTYLYDKTIHEKVKRCLIRKSVEGLTFDTIGLVPCEDSDTVDKLLVLSLETQLTPKENNFVLREKNDDSDLCLTTTYLSDKVQTGVGITKKRVQLHTGSYVALTKCYNAAEEASDYQFGQEFRAVSFKAKSEVLAAQLLQATPAPTATPRVGRYCLKDKEELCLGVSLTNGTVLEENKWLQVKNYTKNSAKDLLDLKLLWYNYIEKGKLMSAARYEYCLEAVYNVFVGTKKSGVNFYDDALHLGLCDEVEGESDLINGVSVVQSEVFQFVQKTNSAGDYLELQTIVPGGSDVKCVSVVQCIKHDFDHCVTYNSNPVYDVDSLQQGAHVRLKDCDSENMVSQRFMWVAEYNGPLPPAFEPTPQPTVTVTHSPTTKTPTKQPTHAPTPKLVTPSPTLFPTTQRPTIFPTTQAPTITEEQQSGEPGGNGANNYVPKDNKNKGLVVGLAFVGVICLAIIVVGGAYYIKNKNSFGKVPVDDDTFIARV